MIIVDTNVTWEILRPSPAAPVRAWFAEQSARDLYTTAITVAEIGYGIARLPDGERKELLAGAAAGVSRPSPTTCCPSTAEPRQSTRTSSSAARARTPISGFDAEIACICRSHGAALATRNLKDSEHVGIELTNPWDWCNVRGALCCGVPLAACE